MKKPITPMLIREFAVCTRKDSNNLVINCQTYNAKMYNNGTFEVDYKIYINSEFQEKFTINIP